MSRNESEVAVEAFLKSKCKLFGMLVLSMKFLLDKVEASKYSTDFVKSLGHLVESYSSIKEPIDSSGIN